jgi:hypothetical protein
VAVVIRLRSVTYGHEKPGRIERLTRYKLSIHSLDSFQNVEISPTLPRWQKARLAIEGEQLRESGSGVVAYIANGRGRIDDQRSIVG